MSREGSSLGQRTLSATEELEKLEQSITLTLQEIDSNFSKAHRIVTASILPVVEQYGEHCRSVWDASKFWKQFFEAAANVSLSGYEELAADGDTTAAEETTTATHDGEEETSMEDNTLRKHGEEDGGDDDGEGGPDRTSSRPHHGHGHDHDARDDSVLTDGDGELSGGTPRPPTTTSLRPQFANIDSPYEALRRELHAGGGSQGKSVGADVDEASTMMVLDNDDASSHASSELLAQRTARLPDMSMTPRPSPDERHRRMLEEERASARRQQDPLMHRVLDKNYRIQATPHRPTARGISPMRLQVTAVGGGAGGGAWEGSKEAAAAATATTTKRAAWQDSSPLSSPEMAVPKLRSAAFLSPVRAAYRSKLAAAVAGPRTPGVSVQTPAAAARTKTSMQHEITFEDIPTGGKGKEAATATLTATTRRVTDEITWESSDEEGDDLYGGMSPPKTISFALPPSKLLQTPAREASKRIVEDILLTAGDDLTESTEYSPTMVKMNANILDDTF